MINSRIAGKLYHQQKQFRREQAYEEYCIKMEENRKVENLREIGDNQEVIK